MKVDNSNRKRKADARRFYVCDKVFKKSDKVRQEGTIWKNHFEVEHEEKVEMDKLRDAYFLDGDDKPKPMRSADTKTCCISGCDKTLK